MTRSALAIEMAVVTDGVPARAVVTVEALAMLTLILSNSSNRARAM